MKVADIEQLKKSISELKKITDVQEYLVSSQANIRYNEMLPILDKELERVSNEKLELNAPAIMVIEKEAKQSLTELMNIQLAKLVSEDYKIVDYSVMEMQGKIIGCIKYTT